MLRRVFTAPASCTIALAFACTLAGDWAGRAHAAGEGNGRAKLDRDAVYLYSVENEVIHQFNDTYDWGFFCGVKQPLGAYKNGMSIHLINKPFAPTEKLANPDHIFWVNENEETYGISMYATGQDDGWHTIPGGMVTFGEDGTIWCNIGGRAFERPLDLYKSDSPYDVENFSVVLEDYETWNSSTTPCVLVHGSKVAVLWRHGWTSSPDTTVRMRRYDINDGFDEYEVELDVGKGAWDDDYGQVGLEQFWVRFDPRFEYMFASWCWWDYLTAFGANPFVYSDDFGDTWRTADGVALQDLPVDFAERTDVLVPYNHFEFAEQAEWNVRDIGVGPEGTFWCTVPTGNATGGGAWKPLFWLFNGQQWESRDITGTMEGQAKPHAVGVTKDFLVFIYSEWTARHQLKARVSADDGYTWSDPILLDEIPGDSIPWISFAQPADGYPDNTVRLFYSHYKQSDGWPGKRWKNNIRWIKFDVVQELFADLNGDGKVNIDDLFQVLGAWGACDDCPEDINDDGIVNIDDLFIVLEHWYS